MFLLTASSTSGIAPDTTTITTMHLILIALLIVLVIGAVLWGMRQKRARSAGEGLEAERTEQMLAHPQTETAVSPAPPPLGDSGMTAPVVAPAPKAVAKPKAAPRPVAVKAPVKIVPTAKPKVAKARVAKPATPAPKPAARLTAKPKVAAPASAAKPLAAKASVAAPLPAKTPANTQPKTGLKPKAVPKVAPAKTPALKVVPAKRVAAPKPAPKAPATQYGLIDVKGLGPKAVPLLEGMGIRTLGDLAKLSAARAAEVDGQLGALSGRMGRDKWIEQAKLLSTGDVAAFEKTYGKL